MITNQNAHDDITEQFRYFKANKSARFTRLLFSDDLIEHYFEQNEQIPPTTVLDRLGTLILQDELADKHPDKMSREEFPMLSERQRDTRQRRESSLMAAADLAVDGRDYRTRNRDSVRKYRETFGI